MLRHATRLASVRVHRAAMVLVSLLLAACARSSDAGVPVRVRRVAYDPATRAPVVLLEDTEHAVALPIWVGPAEAQAIAVHLDGPPPARPLTHDLMKTAFDHFGVGMRRVVIRALQDGTYFADVVLERDGDEVVIDSRPSDAIALAVRCGQPIYVERGLFEREAVVDLHGAERDDVLAVDGITVQALSPALASAFDLTAGHGVVVADVADGAGGGLQRGDVVTEIDGAPVHDTADFRVKLRSGSGEAVLTVQRGAAHFALSLDRQLATE